MLAFVYCPFPSKLKIFCQIILDYILNILNILLWDCGIFWSMDNVNIFVLVRFRFRLQVPTHCWWPIVPMQILFLSPLCATWSSSMCVPSSGWCRTWVVFCLLGQCSKSLVCWFGSDPCIHSLEASPRIHHEFYGVTSLSSSLSMTSLLLSGLQGLPFLSSSQKSGLYLSYFTTHTHKCAMSGSKE